MGPSTTKPSLVGSGILQLHPTYATDCVCNRCCRTFALSDGFFAGDACPYCSGSVADILKERQETHGSFADNAHIAQNLKTVIHNAAGYGHLSLMQKESLDLICTKIGRILSGNPDEPDHWRDIQGYAKLAEPQ